MIFKKSVLDNGSVLLTEQLKQFQSLSIGVWVNTGTRHETASTAGMSHFLEHMMFKGTSNRSALDIAQEVDKVGGEFNAFTTKEYTCFHLLLLARDLNLAIDILIDILLNSKFQDEEIERERKVILQEIAMIEDNPEELVHDFFFEQAFSENPIGKPILGNVKTVSSFKRSDVVTFFKNHYHPSKLIISVAGDVDHEKVKKLFNKYFKKQKLQSKPPLNIKKPKIKSSQKFIRKKLEQSHLLVGFPSLSYTDKDRFVAFLLNVYLGGGMSSSLFQEIREKRGLAYTVYSSLASFVDVGLLSIYVGTDPKEVGHCFSIIAQELRRIKEEKLSKRSLEILKNNLKGTVLLNSDSVESRMTSIAKSEMFFNRYFSVRDICKQIDEVTPEQIQRLAQKSFQASRMVLTLMGPLYSKEFNMKF